MRSYKLVALNKDFIGYIYTENDFTKMDVKIFPERRGYGKAIKKLVNHIVEDKIFSGALVNGSTIKNSSEEFWIVLKQSLLLNLNVLVVGKISRKSHKLMQVTLLKKSIFCV